MLDHSLLGETIDREANNETGLKRENSDKDEDGDFEVYMP
jgi:hypothetical protein